MTNSDHMRDNLNKLRGVEIITESEKISEDNWWADKAKKVGGAIAGKFSSTQQQKLENRRRATELMTAYKKAIGSGLGRTFGDLNRWMLSGDSAKPEIIKAAGNKLKPKMKNGEEITIAKARDFFIQYAAAENLGMTKAKNNKPPKSEPKSEPKSTPSSDDMSDEQVINYMRQMIKAMNNK